MDDVVKNHTDFNCTTGSSQIIMDECNPSFGIPDGDSIPHGVQTSPVAMEEDMSLTVGSHDSGHGTPVTRSVLPSLDWTEGNPAEKDGAGIPMERFGSHVDFFSLYLILMACCWLYVLKTE
ncbi:uncharacterized protein [Oryza sativa Japonica Group]|uniref:uncharacterized protein n=1 Tax=Oryza sativa subsp. japonica TaxID=39947 RepID=UPI00339C672F